jgi:hypothetical protein
VAVKLTSPFTSKSSTATVFFEVPPDSWPTRSARCCGALRLAAEPCRETSLSFQMLAELRYRVRGPRT